MPNYFLSKSHHFLAQDGSPTHADGQRRSLIYCAIDLPPWNRPGSLGAAPSMQTGCTCPFWCVPFSCLEAFLKPYYSASDLSSIEAASTPAAPRRNRRPIKGAFLSVHWYTIAALGILNNYLNYFAFHLKIRSHKNVPQHASPALDPGSFFCRALIYLVRSDGSVQTTPRLCSHRDSYDTDCSGHGVDMSTPLPIQGYLTFGL